ncbi:MAG: type IV toxin-antitoxin system AbiEi family antitoxin [Candidatus Aminicenantales bacterium]
MKEITEEYRKGIGKKESILLSELARQNKPVFTARDAKAILKEDPYLTLHQLKKKKWILAIKGGLYAIVPLDIGVKGAESFIVHDFVVASYLAKPYYIGLWSALNYHGLSDQIPMSVFICTTRPKKPVSVLNSKFVFVQLSKEKFAGIEKVKIEGREVNISDKDKTIVDCLDHPEHAGGIDEVAKAIYFGHEELDFGKIRAYAVKTKNVAVFKRLGFILEATGLLEKYAATFEGVRLTEGYPVLDKLGPKKGKYSERWKLLVNADIDPRRWMY